MSRSIINGENLTMFISFVGCDLSAAKVLGKKTDAIPEKINNNKI